MSDWNQEVITEFRANDGVVGGAFEGIPILILHTTGAKSGQQRENPVAYQRDGERIFVFASKGGSPTHPDWFRNLVAHPDVEVEVGTERYAARATALEGTERDEVYARQVAAIPQFGVYQESTERVIPVVEISRA